MIHLFNRFELKYILEIDKAQALIAALAPHMNPDLHGGEGGYQVSSLYYDSPELDFFWDKIEGVKYRRKVRIRIYPKTEQDTVDWCMVEIKQRINRTVQKRRLCLSLQEAERLCQGELEVGPLTPFAQAVASEIIYLVKAKALQPTCIIHYHRQAFVGKQYNPDLRITFDTQLKTRSHNLTLNQNFKNVYFLPPNCCIMEVKVDNTVPDWVSSLLSQFNCELHRVSKYCAGLAHEKQIAVMNLTRTPPGGTDNYPIKGAHP